ncbi:hypothetical protein COBT_000591 [Conglomerata obtusa]
MKTEKKADFDKVFVHKEAELKLEAIFMSDKTKIQKEEDVYINNKKGYLESIDMLLEEYLVFYGEQTCKDIKTFIAEYCEKKTIEEAESNGLEENDQYKQGDIEQIVTEAFAIYKNNVVRLQRFVYYQYQNTASKLKLSNKDLNSYFFKDNYIIAYDEDAIVKQKIREMVEIASTNSIQGKDFEEVYEGARKVYIKHAYHILIARSIYMIRILKDHLLYKSNGDETEYKYTLSTNITEENKLESKKLSFADNYQKIDATIRSCLKCVNDLSYSDLFLMIKNELEILMADTKSNPGEKHTQIFHTSMDKISDIIKNCFVNIKPALCNLNEQTSALDEFILRLGDDKLIWISTSLLSLNDFFDSAVLICIHTFKIFINDSYDDVDRMQRDINNEDIINCADIICGCVYNSFNTMRAHLDYVSYFLKKLDTSLHDGSDPDSLCLNTYKIKNTDVILQLNAVYNYINSNLTNYISQYEFAIDIYLLIIDTRKHSNLIETEYPNIYNDKLFQFVSEKEYFIDFFINLPEIYENSGKFYLNLFETNFNTMNPIKELLYKKFIVSMERYTYRILKKTKLLSNREDAKDFLQTLSNITFDSDSGIYDADLLFKTDIKTNLTNKQLPDLF